MMTCRHVLVFVLLLFYSDSIESKRLNVEQLDLSRSYDGGGGGGGASEDIQVAFGFPDTYNCFGRIFDEPRRYE